MYLETQTFFIINISINININININNNISIICVLYFIRHHYLVLGNI